MEQATELLMESRSSPKLKLSGADGGAIKSILFAVHDDDALEMRLQAALSLARACSAHIQLLHVVPVEAFTVTDTYGGAFISGEIVEALQGEADKLRLRLEEHLKLEDVSWNYEQTTSVVLAELLRNAAFADLVVIGREPHFHEFTQTGLSLLGELLCNGRTPLLIPGDGRKSFDPFGVAVIAWNGSTEAANAVRAAVGLLRMASDVRIIRYTEDKELSLSDEQLLEYLSRHDIHAQIETHLPKSSASEDLMAFASRAGAEYLVMGGYSHSRAGEFLFGGVTRNLLRECAISLIMAH